MQLHELIDALDNNEVKVSLTTTGRLSVSGPRHAVDTFGPAIREHRDLIVAAIVGRYTGHVLAFCDTCKQPILTAAKTTTGKVRDGNDWPTCRMTPGCGGRNQHGTATARHRPRPTDLAVMASAPRPPTCPQSPAKPVHRRLLGPRPPWPTTTPKETNQ